MIALVHLAASLSIMPRSRARFSVPSRSLRLALNITTDWVMASDVEAARATSILAGADRKVLVMRSISGAIVALKNNV